MKRYIKATSAQISEKELEYLKTIVKENDLFAICYGIIWPKRAQDFPGRKEFNPDGILFADSYVDYRHKIEEIVKSSGSAESSFKFYTIYNKSASGELAEFEKFKSVLGDPNGEYLDPFNSKISQYLGKIVSNKAIEVSNAILNQLGLESSRIYDTSFSQAKKDPTGHWYPYSDIMYEHNIDTTVDEAVQALEESGLITDVGGTGRFRNKGKLEGPTPDLDIYIEIKSQYNSDLLGKITLEFYGWGPKYKQI